MSTVDFIRRGLDFAHRALADARIAIQQAGNAAEQVGNLAASAQGTIDRNVDPAMANLRDTLKSANASMKTLESAIADARPGLKTFSDTTIPGLAVLVTTTDTGNLGALTYTPGVAQRVETAIKAATDAATGYITSTEKDYKARIKFNTAQITQMEVRVAEYEKRLRRQWSQLESAISSLHSQGAWLSNQVAALSG